jgi:hypothetical protein
MPWPRAAHRLASALLGVSLGTSIGGSGRAEPAPERGHTDRRTAVTMIEIVSGDQRWTARIDATPAGRDFLAQLRLELTLKDYGGNEKIADLPRPLTRKGAPEAVTPHAGDVAFYAPWGNLALFYRDGHHSPGLIPLGRIEGGVGGLAGGRPIKVSIRPVAGITSK